MVVVGGITRLTESGLSMVRWEPISGAIPPLERGRLAGRVRPLQASPQYQQINSGMTLADFKAIFFWEYVHRLLGRLIGLAFALPLLFFWWRRAIPPGYGWKLGGLLALGGLQGAIGWWMVASGLVDVPEVSHIRLAVHLLTALLILAGLIWVGARPAGARPRFGGAAGADAHARHLGAVPALPAIPVRRLCRRPRGRLRLQHLAENGRGMVPGRSGMDDAFLRNFVDNPIMVQFVHRWLAFVVAGVALWLALQRLARRAIAATRALLAGAIVAQILLGILTILSGVQIDIAVAHQGMAALLLAAMVIGRPPTRGEAGMSEIVSVYAIFADEEEARRIARIVVEERLAACANILGPCHSIYRWQGEVEEAARSPAIFKTSAEAAPRLVERIAALHSYDVPAIAIWPILEALPAYAAWVIDEGRP